MRLKYILLAFTILCAHAAAFTRDLIIVNGLGETVDFVELTDSTLNSNIATLGLAPNDFLVAGNTGIAVNSTSNDLYFFSLPSMSPLGTLFLGNGRNPYCGAVIDSNAALITNLIASTITKINIATRSVIGEYNVGKSPEGVVIVGRNAYVCISNFDFGNYTYGQGYVQSFDLISNAVVETIPVGTNPQDIAFGYDGYLYVVCTGNYSTQSGILYKLAPTNGSVIDSLPIGGTPASLAITRSGVLFLSAGGWADHGEVYTVDLGDFTVVRGPGNPISTGLGVTTVTTVSDSTIISCNFGDDTITEIAPSGRILATFRTGDGPVAAAKYPACYVAKGDANGSGEINISDAVYLIAYVFGGGLAPVTIDAGNTNCDLHVNISDAVSILAYIFAGGFGSCGCAD
jgi:hypothetical protein